jgi:hypothetical protein
MTVSNALGGPVRETPALAAGRHTRPDDGVGGRVATRRRRDACDGSVGGVGRGVRRCVFGGHCGGARCSSRARPRVTHVTRPCPVRGPPSRCLAWRAARRRAAACGAGTRAAASDHAHFCRRTGGRGGAATLQPAAHGASARRMRQCVCVTRARLAGFRWGHAASAVLARTRPYTAAPAGDSRHATMPWRSSCRGECDVKQHPATDRFCPCR